MIYEVYTIVYTILREFSHIVYYLDGICKMVRSRRLETDCVIIYGKPNFCLSGKSGFTQVGIKCRKSFWNATKSLKIYIFLNKTETKTYA